MIDTKELDRLMKLSSFHSDESLRYLNLAILHLNPECETVEEVRIKLNPPKIILSMEALEVLNECIVDGNLVRLPDIKLDREDYMQVKKKLELIGGKWKGGKVQGFEFKENPTALLTQIAGGKKVNLQKEFQFFATPDTLARRMVHLASIGNEHDILEPSAGQGALVKAIQSELPGKIVYCYELMPINLEFLKKMRDTRILGEDFLQNDNDDKYDRIIANPPFNKNQDIDHIKEMYDLLKPGGRIVTVASPSWTFGSQKKQVAFREWLKEINAEVEEIPAGVFKESGTSIRAMLLVIDKAA